MANQEACASCASTQSLKRCARCSKVWYCSKACQRAHWKSHKPSCHYQVGSSTTNQPAKTDDALSLLRGMPDPGTAANALAQKLFNIIELRLAVFSELSASELLRLQRTCRSWYLTIALEPKLQQRLFMTAGPGELVCPARRGDKLFPGMQPRNESQRRAFDMEKNSFGPVGVHLVTNQTGDVREMSAAEVEKEGGQVILNPFFTSLWPQDPANMTLSPRITVPTGLMTASWRRMQLTSPPLKSLSMSLWYTKSNGAGNQLLPHTGEVASGVTLGHVADILVAQPKKLAYHWIQLHGQSWWLRSADAVVVPQEGDVRDQGARPGVYVNPSNQIAFPGFLGPTSLSFNAAESKSFLG